MRFPRLTTTSYDPVEAQKQFIEQLLTLSASGEDLDQLFVEGAAASKQKLDAWSRLVEHHTGKKFDAMEISLKNGLQAELSFPASPCIVASSICLAPLTEETSKLIRHNKDVQGIYYQLPDDLVAMFMHQHSAHQQKEEYKNHFDFLYLHPKDPGNYISNLQLPYQSIDHRICAALHETGHLDEFSELLGKLIERTGHDCVHAALKNRRNPQAHNILEEIGPFEEPHALQTHSAIYDEIKHTGFAHKLARDARQLLDIIDDFDAHSQAQDHHNMAASLRNVIAYHLSNFVERGYVEKELATNPSAEALEHMLLTVPPGNPIDQRIYRGYDTCNIYELAADCFKAITDFGRMDEKTITLYRGLRAKVDAAVSSIKVEDSSVHPVTSGREPPKVTLR